MRKPVTPEQNPEDSQVSDKSKDIKDKERWGWDSKTLPGHFYEFSGAGNLRDNPLESRDLALVPNVPKRAQSMTNVDRCTDSFWTVPTGEPKVFSTGDLPLLHVSGLG